MQNDAANSEVLPYLGKAESEVGIVGPMKGFSPQIGTIVSMMAFIRRRVLKSVSGMSIEDLDFLLDSRANTVGAILLHLAATETYYQMNTFDSMQWDSWSDEIKRAWDIPMHLGERARKAIKATASITTSRS